jgi:hypothetical protein
MSKVSLFEILVPTKYEDTGKPVRLRHHKEWDKVVRKVSNGMTILRSARGQWAFEGKLYEDRVIPVRLTANDKQMKDIAEFTKSHYRQLAVMYYKISDEVYFV